MTCDMFLAHRNNQIAMEIEDALFFKDRAEWQTWLERNHDRETELWLGFHKKHTSKGWLQLDEAVEEAIRFGWIDGKLRRIDDEKHKIRFSPRRRGSVWSKINRERAERLIEEGKMTAAGLEKIEEAKQSGRWAAAYSHTERPELPEDLKEALSRNPRAWENFNQFSNSNQFMYVFWVNEAKRESTRKKRVDEVVERSARNEKPG